MDFSLETMIRRSKKNLEMEKGNASIFDCVYIFNTMNIMRENEKIEKNENICNIQIICG